MKIAHASALRGNSIIELLIAFAVLTLAFTALILVVFGNQSVSVDSARALEARAYARMLLTNERSLARADFIAASSTQTIVGNAPYTYSALLTIDDISPCEKRVSSAVSWRASTLRRATTTFSTVFTSLSESKALGSDCSPSDHIGTWSNPHFFAADTLQNAASAFDALDGRLYIGLRASPWFAILDTRHAFTGQTTGLLVHFDSWSSDALGARPYAMDAITRTDAATGASHTYVYAAMDRNDNQLAVIDATDETHPHVSATISLPCVAQSGSAPQGWYLYAYKDRLYLTTRYTKGPELHIFDISNPTAPVELPTNAAGASCTSGLGYELGDTVEQFVVRDQVVGGVVHRYAYLVTDENDREIRILDVTNPAYLTEVRDIDLPGIVDGESVYVLGTRLYVGRLATSNGPELYVYDSADPMNGVTELGSAEIGASVLAIRVADDKAFLATTKPRAGLEVWGVADATNITEISSLDSGTLLSGGLDIESTYVYGALAGIPNVQIFNSP